MDTGGLYVAGAAFAQGGVTNEARIDELRVSQGARYSGASFTPPAAPFVVD